MKKVIYLILAGVAIGILIAPDKGSQTLREIKAGIDDLKDELIDQINDLAVQRQALLETSKGTLEIKLLKFNVPSRNSNIQVF